jgi:hypothetical protein|tara:strand:- start:106 stop:774 length:669 start_codon:yes stop_codon:yes gene_type:complete
MLLNSFYLYLKKFVIIIFLSVSFQNFAQEIAILKYNGGGDWYANPTALPNLIGFSNKHINTLISENPRSIAVDNSDLFNYPIVFMTGHGNVYFTEEEAKNLREYLISGGFLHISDNYGLDKYIRRELKKVFSKIELQEIPNNHPIYNQTFIFKNGLPKIHEHDKKEPKGFGLFFKGRLVCFYDYESDLSDGWEDASIHNNPEEIRLKALQMGSNIIEYAFKN